MPLTLISFMIQALYTIFLCCTCVISGSSNKVTIACASGATSLYTITFPTLSLFINTTTLFTYTASATFTATRIIFKVYIIVKTGFPRFTVAIFIRLLSLSCPKYIPKDSNVALSLILVRSKICCLTAVACCNAFITSFLMPEKL